MGVDANLITAVTFLPLATAVALLATSLVAQMLGSEGPPAPVWRGLGLATGDRLYVLEIQPAARRVVVGGRQELSRNGLIGERLHWIGPAPAGDTEAVVRIRSRHAGVASRIRTLPGRRAEVEFAEPQEGVAPGQAVVFYEGSRILGGCWITGAQPA